MLAFCNKNDIGHCS